MYETQDGNEPRALAIVAPRVQLDQQKLLVLKATIAPGLTGPELAFFGHVCQRMQLDPFARQIYAIKRGDKLTIQVGIDGFRALAERTGLYRGQLGPLWCGADGVWLDAWLSDEAPVAAKVGVIRAGFAEPIWAVARTKAYRQDSNTLWRTMPDVLIAKCAEALALRKTFPDALGGAYEHDEMDQAGHAAIVDEAEYQAAQVAEAAPSAEAHTAQQPAPKPAKATVKPAQPAPAQPSADEHNNNTVSAGAWDALKKRLTNELGLTTPPQQAAFIRAMLKRDMAGELPTRAEYATLTAGVTRTADQKRTAEAKLGRTATARPAAPAPSADELAAAQADYDASQASADDFPSEANGYDLSKLEVPAVRP